MTPSRAAWSWLVLLAVAFANGALRQLAYPATLGDFAARQVAAGVGAVALGATIWLLLRRWPVATARSAWATGALWATLTVAFEVALVRAGGGSWEAALDQYAIWRGSLWPLLVLWVAVAPAALSALQQRRAPVGPTLAWAVAGWAACGATFGVARAAAGLEAALWIHLAAAPAIAAAATWLVGRHPRHPGPLATALVVAGVPAYLDAVLVAPFLERSFEMFQSALGTWLPLALMLAASAATGAVLAGRRGAQLGPGPA
jgi:hypothetical protein